MDKSVPILPTNVQLKRFRKEILRKYYAPSLGLDATFMSLALGMCTRSIRFYLKEIKKEGTTANE
jgi:hypothetical protein